MPLERFMIRTTYEDELDRKGTLTYTCSGISMLPMLRQHRDLFTIKKKQGRCKKYDVALYKRPATGEYVLHRVVKVRENGYVILGDNCLNKEYGIKEDEVIGVMTSFVRDGKEYPVSHKGYRLYASVWYMLYPIRKVWMIGKGKCRKLLQKVR